MVIKTFGGYELAEVKLEQITREAFSLSVLPTAYSFTNVLLNNGNFDITLSKSDLLSTENGGKRLYATQESWRKHREWELPPLPIINALIMTCYREREGVYKDAISEVAQGLSKSVESGIMTNSTLRYLAG